MNRKILALTVTVLLAVASIGVTFAETPTMKMDRSPEWVKLDHRPAHLPHVQIYLVNASTGNIEPAGELDSYKMLWGDVKVPIGDGSCTQYNPIAYVEGSGPNSVVATNGKSVVPAGRLYTGQVFLWGFD